MVPSGEVSMVPESPTVTNNPVVVELSVLVVLSLLLQEMKEKLKRSKERMMSRCFNWFPISGLGEPKLYHNLGYFTRMWELLGGCLTVKN